MKMSKLYGWLLATFMFLPIVSIAVRAIYVQKNPNAYMSYSGTNGYEIEYKYKTNEVNSSTDLISGNIYTITLNEQPSTTIQYCYASRIIFNEQAIDLSTSFESENDYIILMQSGTTGNIYFQYNGAVNSYQINANSITYPISFDVVYKSNASNYALFSESQYNEIEGVNINNTGTLDNAFSYSVQEFNNVGFNKINFTQWFTSFFTNGDNLYTTFINSYANYILFTACAMAIPYFLYWFVMFAMSLMDRFARKDIIR